MIPILFQELLLPPTDAAVTAASALGRRGWAGPGSAPPASNPRSTLQQGLSREGDNLNAQPQRQRRQQQQREGGEDVPGGSGGAGEASCRGSGYRGTTRSSRLQAQREQQVGWLCKSMEDFCRVWLVAW